MFNFIFTNAWEKEFLKLDEQAKKRILWKLQFFKTQVELNHYFKKLTDMEPATHRLRIWSIRVILQQIDNKTFYVLDVWYRGDIYK